MSFPFLAGYSTDIYSMRQGGRGGENGPLRAVHLSRHKWPRCIRSVGRGELLGRGVLRLGLRLLRSRLSGHSDAQGYGVTLHSHVHKKYCNGLWKPLGDRSCQTKWGRALFKRQNLRPSTQELLRFGICLMRSLLSSHSVAQGSSFTFGGS